MFSRDLDFERKLDNELAKVACIVLCADTQEFVRGRTADKKALWVTLNEENDDVEGWKERVDACNGASERLCLSGSTCPWA